MCLLTNLKDLLSTVWLAHPALASLSDWIMVPIVASASWGRPPKSYSGSWRQEAVLLSLPNISSHSFPTSGKTVIQLWKPLPPPVTITSWKGICSHWKNELKPQRIKVYLYYSNAEKLHRRLIAANAVLTHVTR